MRISSCSNIAHPQSSEACDCLFGPGLDQQTSQGSTAVAECPLHYFTSLHYKTTFLFCVTLSLSFYLRYRTPLLTRSYPQRVQAPPDPILLQKAGSSCPRRLTLVLGGQDLGGQDWLHTIVLFLTHFSLHHYTRLRTFHNALILASFFASSAHHPPQCHPSYLRQHQTQN